MPVIQQLSGLAAETIVQTVLRFRGGLADQLKRVPTIDDNPVVAFLASISTSGSHPSSACGDCKVVGGEGVCQSVLTFGRVCFGHDITIEDAIKRVNAGQITPELVGELVSPEVLEDWKTNRRLTRPENILQAAVAWGMTEVAMALSDEISVMVWRGSNTGNAGYRTPIGLENFILNASTYITPRQTGGNCSSSMPLVAQYDDNYNATDDQGSVLIRTIARVASILATRASGTGLFPVEWAICMPSELRELLVFAWAAAYSTTYGYQLPAGTSFVVDASAVSSYRDRLLRENTVMINGRSFRLIGDDGIAVTTGTDNSANIYFIPLSVRGQVPATYLNYLDLSAFGEWSEVAQFTWTDSGMVQWWWQQNGPCMRINGMVQYRPVLIAPHLSAAITGVHWPIGSPAWPMPSRLS